MDTYIVGHTSGHVCVGNAMRKATRPLAQTLVQSPRCSLECERGSCSGSCTPPPPHRAGVDMPRGWGKGGGVGGKTLSAKIQRGSEKSECETHGKWAKALSSLSIFREKRGVEGGGKKLRGVGEGGATLLRSTDGITSGR